MRTDAELAEAITKAADPCFDAVDRDFVEAQLAAGEFFFAVDDALRAAVREHFALPANLVEEAKTWIADIPEDDDVARLRQMLDTVATNKNAA